MPRKNSKFSNNSDRPVDQKGLLPCLMTEAEAHWCEERELESEAAQPAKSPYSQSHSSCQREHKSQSELRWPHNLPQ